MARREKGHTPIVVVLPALVHLLGSAVFGDVINPNSVTGLTRFQRVGQTDGQFTSLSLEVLDLRFVDKQGNVV
ncbi:MAG: hypothetical protein LBJ36_02110, partial [Synergistaceae bacterium]|nr:hypothetical protein [Synergistaceae bacterium]